MLTKLINQIMQNPLFIHTVYFWLTDDASQSDREAFEKGLEVLGTSPCSTHYYWGVPLSDDKREVVDSSYDYGSSTFFDSEEQHDIYQSTDAVHMNFINSFKHLWKAVKVFDHKMK